MRFRATAAIPAVVAAAALLTAAPRGSAAPAGTCPEKDLSVQADASPTDPDVVRLSVTNRGEQACDVDLVPVVAFRGLDGAALPTPARSPGTYRLAASGTAYAAVRTIVDPRDPEARHTDMLIVAADPAHLGRPFTARGLGTGEVIRVWEPVTTWWLPSAAAADRALGDG